MAFMMHRMLKYIWSSLLLLVPVLTWGADSTSTANRWYKGFFLDVDLIEPVQSIFNDDHKGGNASLSVNFKDAFFPTVLVGYSSYDASGDYSSYTPQDGYTYKVNGLYCKVGLDFNLLRSKKKYKPECYLGARYAFSTYSFDVLNVSMPSMGWSNTGQINESGNTFAQWGEFVGGVRVPVYKRLYLGLEGDYKWSFSPKSSSFNGPDGNKVVINQSYAPGFGDSNGTTWGFRYMVSFFF